MATDVADQAKDWAADEIDKLRLGEHYGYAVNFGPGGMAPGPAGPVMVPGWVLLLFGRAPIVGQKLFWSGPVGSPDPDEKMIRAAVGEGIGQMRAAARAMLAGQNGRGSHAGPNGG